MDGCWDAGTASSYLKAGTAVYRLSSDNVVTLVAGNPEQEEGVDADEETAPLALTADGAGTLFVLKKRTGVQRVQLPRACLATTGAADSAVPRSGIGEAAAEAVTVVTTLAAPALSRAQGLCYIPSGSNNIPPSGALVVSSMTALYYMPLGVWGAGLGLWAGQEGERGVRDGAGREALFICITGLAADGNGCVYVVDSDSGRTSVRKVDPSGAVTTIAYGLKLSAGSAAILPNGCLAIAGDCRLHVMDLGLLPPRDIALPPAAPAASLRPLPAARTLPSDLGALLERQPDGTADVEVVVGDRTFHVHRALVAARCDYFRQLLGGGFAEGGAARLTLPDTDPEAFALVLRFLYTGAVDVPAAQVRPLAELADRLLLPELCRDAQERVLAEVGPESVVDAMLWAEGRGPGFSQLLADLKAWFLQHYEEVLGAAEGSIDRLAVERPMLMAELFKGCAARSAKRPRPA
ncbi:hypothetical protein GPECTOR_37g189 [Gonium pectorale]|uniref:BTB domain-containing protein n=1 Tax=Gonium pectorale TaxID=33097 RepID=A0A150GBP4_GONPE|nr:hypothetical protein GPECTOR_37g189 [Gonium pectorale]|eukprot:KXZ47183.1 hypothetical protein GPECTOR_37g189 [Gonium pectorale]